MSIPTTTMFNDLISRFPTSDELFAFLRSPEGGNLTIRTDKMTPEHPFALIYYEKDKSDMTLPHVGAFRSVVWNVNTNQPVCVGPARGMGLSVLPADTVLTTGDYYVEDFVDGVMLNLFHDGRQWVLATRTQLGADGHFYGTRPFRELFWEAFTAAGLDHVTDLNPAYSYSWVLQHPEERIVVAPEYGLPRLYLVATSGPTSALRPALQSLRPKEHSDIHSVADVMDRVTTWGKRYGAKWQGLVVYGSGGVRYKVRSAEYTEARALRGNQPKRPFTWLERWGELKLGQYLRLYPEERVEAEALVARFKACTQELYDLYQKVYRERAFPLREAPQKYRKLLWDCHKENAGSYFPNTRTFMNKQDTARKLWLCNYEVRYGATATATATAHADPAPLDGQEWPALNA